MDIFIELFDIAFGDTGNVFLWIIFLICIAFIIREIVLWYWKINRIVELLEKIEKNTNNEKNEEVAKFKNETELKNVMKKSIFD